MERTKNKKLALLGAIVLAITLVFSALLMPAKATAHVRAEFTGDSLVGTTWQFNEADYITTPSVKEEYYLSFNTNSESMSSLIIGQRDEKRNIQYDYSTVLYGVVWELEAYRTIEITGGTDATNSTLIAWLNENATLLSYVEPTPSPSTGVVDSALTVAIFAVTVGFALAFVGFNRKRNVA